MMAAGVLVTEWTDICIQWNRKPLRNKHDMVKSTQIGYSGYY
jgi:hypothetical protein